MPTLWIIVGIINLLGACWAYISDSSNFFFWWIGGALVAFTVASIIRELRSIREAIERSRDQQALSDNLGGPRWVTTQKN